MGLTIICCSYHLLYGPCPFIIVFFLIFKIWADTHFFSTLQMRKLIFSEITVGPRSGKGVGAGSRPVLMTQVCPFNCCCVAVGPRGTESGQFGLLRVPLLCNSPQFPLWMLLRCCVSMIKVRLPPPPSQRRPGRHIDQGLTNPSILTPGQSDGVLDGCVRKQGRGGSFLKFLNGTVKELEHLSGWGC